MPDAPSSPLFWSIAELIAAYRDTTLSPVDVATQALDRIRRHDGDLHAFTTVTDELLLAQAADAADAYGRGEAGPLLGVPVAVKDAFHVAGVVTTCGSEVLREHVAKHDSGVVRRLRAAGALFTGKTNTPEFCQSATTDNLLLPDTGNPWDPARTSGGSSGGSAAAVGAGLSNVAVGSDGGGSIRIPAAFTGLVGVKPTHGLCPDEQGVRTMSPFADAGPMTRTVADARVLLGVLADRAFPRRRTSRGLRVGWCPRPEDHPVDTGVADRTADAVRLLGELGCRVDPVEPPLDGWQDVFGPLVVEEEHRERGHLLELAADRLTRYEAGTLRAGRDLDPAAVSRAWDGLAVFRSRFDRLFDDVDVIACPTVAVPAFPNGRRPRSIGGQPVSGLWGAFPFTSPFNVAGTPAVTLPCGFADGLPVGIQLIGRRGADAALLDLCEELEEALTVDSTDLTRRWRDAA